MSITNNDTSRERTSATFSRLPLTRLSTITTRSPRAASCLTSSDPMKPAPPVTTTLDRLVAITPLYSALYGHVSRSRRTRVGTMPVAPSQQPGRHARDDGKRRYVLGHDRTSTNDGP